MSKTDKKNRKNRLDIVYSTNPDFNYEYDTELESETLLPENQKLKIRKDKKQRKGKVVTLIENFVGTDDDLKELSKKIKNKCGTGGTAKNGEIVIQGDFVQKINDFLTDCGYKTKVVGA